MDNRYSFRGAPLDRRVSRGCASAPARAGADVFKSRRRPRKRLRETDAAGGLARGATACVARSEMSEHLSSVMMVVGMAMNYMKQVQMQLRPVVALVALMVAGCSDDVKPPILARSD